MKNFLTAAFLVLITLPFVLMNDFYPFFRFGMFAEPIEEVEFFRILEKKEGTGFREINQKKIGLSREQINYMARHHIYSKESTDLLEKIIPKEELKKKEYRLIRVLFDVSSGTSDTTVIDIKN